MDEKLEAWLLSLVEKLDPEKIVVNTEEGIVGYYWNRKKKELHFISLKESQKLSKKGLVWKPLGEDW